MTGSPSAIEMERFIACAIVFVVKIVATSRATNLQRKDVFY
jgi:hypothetical protein